MSWILVFSSHVGGHIRQSHRRYLGLHIFLDFIFISYVMTSILHSFALTSLSLLLHEHHVLAKRISSLRLAHSGRLVTVGAHDFKVSFVLSQVGLVHIVLLVSGRVKHVGDGVGSSHKVRVIGIHITILYFNETLDHRVGRRETVLQ